MCVRTMAQTESLRLMMKAMKARPDCLNIAAEALNRMFEKENSELVAQVMTTKRILYKYRKSRNNLKTGIAEYNHK